jgi:hypothetical protein
LRNLSLSKKKIQEELNKHSRKFENESKILREVYIDKLDELKKLALNYIQFNEHFRTMSSILDKLLKMKVGVGISEPVNEDDVLKEALAFYKMIHQYDKVNHDLVGLILEMKEL